MNQTLLEKYNIPVPRYTSYPPANYFREGIDNETYRWIIQESNRQQPAEISFYFHLPFCRKMCHYCGCNSQPMVSSGLVDRYMEALCKEMDLVIPLLDRTSRKISQIHYGGGTPSAFPAIDLEELNRTLLYNFEQIEEPEIAIECHPGGLSEHAWIALSKAGFNRFSIGIQDFNQEVLKAVNRENPICDIGWIIKMLKGFGHTVNLDFIYGLPLQTADSFTDTIRKAIDLQPDRLVTFSYAHMPSIYPRQKMLDRIGLPSNDEKSRMFEAARKLLLDAGYKQIGMDHFVREEDELFRAKQNGLLHRNFQGYCTRRTTGQVYAFGVTGISQLNTAYVQNTKNIHEYIEKVEAGILPVAKGYELNKEEQITRNVIEMLMCNNLIDWGELADRMHESVATLKEAVCYDRKKLQDFAADGIIEWNEKRIRMTEEGMLFVRNVAASFDRLMTNSTKLFSKPV